MGVDVKVKLAYTENEKQMINVSELINVLSSIEYSIDSHLKFNQDEIKIEKQILRKLDTIRKELKID